MNFAGFLPLSLCDFPGRPASVLFTQGCNLRCPWCHNGHLLPRETTEKKLDPAHLLATLAQRRNLVPNLVVSGGEPTLHATLPEFLRDVKALGLDIKLDTNGTRPAILRALVRDRLVDFIAMDIKAPWHKYPALTGLPGCDVDAIRESMDFIAASGLPHQFRTTDVTPLLTDADRAAIAAQIPPGSPHAWQKFRPETSLDETLRTPLHAEIHV